MSTDTTDEVEIEGLQGLADLAGLTKERLEAAAYAGDEDGGSALLSAFLCARSLMDELTEEVNKTLGTPEALVDAAVAFVWQHVQSLHRAWNQCARPHPGTCPVANVEPPYATWCLVERYLGRLEGVNGVSITELALRAYVQQPVEEQRKQDVEVFLGIFGEVLIHHALYAGAEEGEVTFPIDPGYDLGILLPFQQHMVMDLVKHAETVCPKISEVLERQKLLDKVIETSAKESN